MDVGLLLTDLVTLVVVIVAVPAVLAGYIIAGEYIVRLFPDRMRGGIRPWIWVGPALIAIALACNPSPNEGEPAALPHLVERGEQLLPLEEKRAAGLVAAERAHQLDRPPPADAEHPFEDRAVDHGGRKRGDLRDDFRQLKQPIGLGGQWGRASGSSMILHR